MGISTADVIIVATIVISTGIGIYRGFLRELVTLLTWVIAAVIAYLYGIPLGEQLVFIDNETIRNVLGVTFAFLGVVFVGVVLKLLIVKAAKIVGVTKVDRIVGGLFGVVRGCVLIVLILLLSSENITKQSWYQESKLLPSFVSAAEFSAQAVPKDWKEDVIESIDNIKEDQEPAPVQDAMPVTEETPAKKMSVEVEEGAPVVEAKPSVKHDQTDNLIIDEQTEPQDNQDRSM